MEAGRRGEISTRGHALTVVAPRSSSLPMGSSSSKPPEPSVAQKVRRAFRKIRKDNDSDTASFHLPTTSLPLQVSPSSASSPPNIFYTPPRPLPPQPPPQPPPRSRPDPTQLPTTPLNRSSIIPVSPAIESALNFLVMSDQPHAHDRPSIPSQAANPPASDFSSSENQFIPSKPTTHDKDRSPQYPGADEPRRIERPRAKSESEGIFFDRDYADKRKSDSTISHCTIRPGAGASRSSRPVSMAESFQSTFTIVPPTGSSNTSSVVMVNKRVSLVDPDLGSLEEDDDSFKSIDVSEDQRSSIVIIPTQDRFSSPSLNPKRRSISLNTGAAISNSSILHAHQTLPSPSAAELKYPSHSISEGFYHNPSTTSSSLALSHSNYTQPWTPQRPQYNRNQKLPPIPPQVNPNAIFTYPTQRPPPNHPTSPPSFRQTAVSFTSSLAPAAGFARKAVERVKGALGHMGHHGGGSHSGSLSSVSISSASGCSSSASVSSTAPSSFPNEWGVLNLARTPSNTSSVTHATHSSSMHAVNIKEVKERSERERQQQAAAEKKRIKKMRRTPGSQSGGASYSIGSVCTTSGSESDALLSTGPILGMLLRGPLRNRNGIPAASGVVFGRELSKCVRDTLVWSGKEDGVAGRGKDGREIMGRPELKVYERRMLPAVVVRCAQHLLIWGVQEEGLFRVPGRAAHIAKLRSEFDTGVDYDMSGCAPGDLDPHAVASIFKAYLRELPEHLLTQKLSGYFDVAIEQESITTITADPQTPSLTTRNCIGLPSSQRPSQHHNSMVSPVNSASSASAFPAPNLRKPPSLSTFAMPSFTGMRPASHKLISALRSLITKLPRENRDLLRTVVELVRATAKESVMTKMPLSNLLMVFLPSLNVSAQLLRVLCEDERIWVGLVDVEVEGQEQQGKPETAEEEEAVVLDLRRDTVVLDIRQHSDDQQQKADGEYLLNETEESEEDEEDDDENLYRRRIVINRPEVPTIYLDTRSQASSPSIASSHCTPSSKEASTTESSVLHDDMSSISVSTRDDTDGILSSSVESVMTPLTSSAHSSDAHLPLDPLETVKDLSGRDAEEAAHATSIVGPRIQVVEPAPVGLEIGVEKEEGHVRRYTVSSPLPVSSPVITPTSANHEKNSAQTHVSPKRRSIPGLSFPSLSAFGHRNSHGSSGSEPVSPAESSSSDKANANTGKDKGPGLRTKKPSLKLLFSKKSAGSFSGGPKDIIVVNSPCSSRPGSAPGSAGSHSSVSQQLRAASMLLTGGSIRGCNDGSGSSDSSVSTPVSAVTCPGTVVGSAGGIGSSASASVFDLPPVLDAPFEEESSLRHELGLEESPPGTATPQKPPQKERVKTMIRQTPIADWYSMKSAANSVNALQSVGAQHRAGSLSDEVDGDGGDERDEEENDGLTRRRTVMGRGRSISVSSQLSLNHLGMDDNELGAEEDWTRSVLLAADVEFGLDRRP